MIAVFECKKVNKHMVDKDCRYILLKEGMVFIGF